MSTSTYDAVFPPNFASGAIPAAGAGEITIQGDNTKEVRVIEVILQNRGNHTCDVRFMQGDGTTEYFSWHVPRQTTERLGAATYANGLELDCDQADVYIFCTFYTPPTDD